jgi:hypothetical protein
VSISVLSSSYNHGFEPSRAVVYAGCVGMNVALVSHPFVINIGRVENTVGLSVPGSKAYDDLKSARRRTLARKSGGKKSSRVYG